VGENLCGARKDGGDKYMGLSYVGCEYMWGNEGWE
jgi:hypothetical protein